MTQPNQSELKCGHTAPDWNGEGDCITCARDKVLGNQSELRKQLKTYNWSSDKDYQVACIAFKELITANYTPNSEVAERERVARLNEAFLIGVKYEKGEYQPAEYMIERKNELEAYKKPQR